MVCHGFFRLGRRILFFSATRGTLFQRGTWTFYQGFRGRLGCLGAPPAPRVISASPSVFLVFLHRGPGEEEHRESYISYIARVRSILIPGRHDRDHQQRRGSVFRADSGSLSGGSFRRENCHDPFESRRAARFISFPSRNGTGRDWFCC